MKTLADGQGGYACAMVIAETASPVSGWTDKSAWHQLSVITITAIATGAFCLSTGPQKSPRCNRNIQTRMLISLSRSFGQLGGL